MAFSNPFDDPQGVFYILRNAQAQASCQQWLDAHWRTLTPANFIQQQEAQ